MCMVLKRKRETYSSTDGSGSWINCLSFKAKIYCGVTIGVPFIHAIIALGVRVTASMIKCVHWVTLLVIWPPGISLVRLLETIYATSLLPIVAIAL